MSNLGYFLAIFGIWAKRPHFGQKVKKFDLAKMVRDIVIKPKGGYQGTFRLFHRPKNICVILVILVILTIFAISAKRANFRQKSEKSEKNLKIFKLWHAAYQIAGIFDAELKYGTHFVENHIFEKILGQKFGPKIQTVWR